MKCFSFSKQDDDYDDEVRLISLFYFFASREDLRLTADFLLRRKLAAFGEI